jgi:hypothetical protein
VRVVSLRLTTPFLARNGLAPAVVAAEVESHVRRDLRRDWRRNDVSFLKTLSAARCDPR